ncbi:hypothetical protein BCR34DRAFT_478000, partial [Clohesyomyces aquaticus]
ILSSDRSHAASSRLHVQFYQYKGAFKFNIHPSVSPLFLPTLKSPNLRQGPSCRSLASLPSSQEYTSID